MALHIDAEKVLAASSSGVEVLAFPRDPPPLPMVPGKTEPPRPPLRGQHLYTLQSGSSTLGPIGGVAALGVAVDTAEVVVVYNDKVRVYDFSP
jgi:hypothetical protein